ncbi:baseplate J protein [Gordonia phage Skog]|uniref:Baseplate J protein n=1 Tax=Gordonia phage Skog TaxID=2704033 RepID=A0A6G6XKG5_9CAUD|nr:virion structural protein [Gordonia phage Skog]QIG58345.1 baseplate J protein [Gordonia phage Skog]
MATVTSFPYFPGKSTELRMAHFDEIAYTADSTTTLYKFLDALCGDAGAGSLKKELFVQRLSASIETMYGSDLDYVFGSIRFLSRLSSEAYDYDPMSDMLTSDQWDEVKVKDAWFRARIVGFFTACAYGSQDDGLRNAVHSAVSSDCEIFEVWRYLDNFEIAAPLGRAPVTARNEVVVKPHKSSISPQEFRVLRDMIAKFIPIDTIVTIDTDGLMVAAPVGVNAIAADSSYYQVEKEVTGTPLLDQIPEPELLAIDLLPSEKWIFSKFPQLAPYAAFNISSETCFYYLVSGGARSPIDSVTYGTLDETGQMVAEASFEMFQETGVYSDWHPYEVADSPDNYPGGKYGLHPYEAPAVNPDQSEYQFPYASQKAYVDTKKAEVLAMGGIATDSQYRTPITQAGQTKRTYTPDLAVAYTAPTKDSTVTSSSTSRRPSGIRREIRDPAIMIRS